MQLLSYVQQCAQPVLGAESMRLDLDDLSFEADGYGVRVRVAGKDARNVTMASLLSVLRELPDNCGDRVVKEAVLMASKQAKLLRRYPREYVQSDVALLSDIKMFRAAQKRDLFRLRCKVDTMMRDIIYSGDLNSSSVARRFLVYLRLRTALKWAGAEMSINLQKNRSWRYQTMRRNEIAAEIHRLLQVSHARGELHWKNSPFFRLLDREANETALQIGNMRRERAMVRTRKRQMTNLNM